MIVQPDIYNQKLRHAVAAEVTTNLGVGTDAANLLVETGTPDGQASGLFQDSVVTCLHLVTLSENRFDKVIGKLSSSLLQGLDNCLKAVLGLP